MSRHADWLRRADAAILLYLFREQPTYVPIVAQRLGIHLDYAEDRVERLVDAGFVEPVSAEVVYRITDRGERHLAAYRDAEGDPQPGHAPVEPAD